jgi:hypothetical protein
MRDLKEHLHPNLNLKDLLFQLPHALLLLLDVQEIDKDDRY